MTSVIAIREERPADVDAVRRLNELAFGVSQEAALVDQLRERCDDVLSLVACEGDQVVGHLFFSPAAVAGTDGLVVGMGLAPMAVLPGRQREGIGSALVRHGLERLAAAGCPFVIVLGHPGYYPRFGFQRASAHGLQCSWDGVPDEAFMVVILDAAAMEGVTGVVRYRSEFDAAI